MTKLAPPPVTWFPAAAANIYNPGRLWYGRAVLWEAFAFHTTAGGSTLKQLGDWFGGGNIASGVGKGSTWFGVDPDGNYSQHVSLANAAIAHGRLDRPTAKLVFDNFDAARGAYVDPNLWCCAAELLDAGKPGVHTPRQLEAAARLCAWFFQDHILPHAAVTGAAVDRDHILGHYEFDAVNRPGCPGWDEARWRWMVGTVGDLLAPVVVPETPPVVIPDPPIDATPPAPIVTLRDYQDALTLEAAAHREEAVWLRELATRHDMRAANADQLVLKGA